MIEWSPYVSLIIDASEKTFISNKLTMTIVTDVYFPWKKLCYIMYSWSLIDFLFWNKKASVKYKLGNLQPCY